MSFLTKVITDTSPDFGDNPQIVTENGQPSSVDVENLVPNTGYWTKAEIWQNGVLNDTSEVEDFQTLPAGTITLTHQSSVRSGSNYIVTYTYTSTYALSSSVLTCGVSISSQGVIAGNTITFTVSGMVPGDAYMSQITTIDMYGESAQTSITLIMPVVNEVSITGTTRTTTTIECELDYTIDGGFTQGWVDYWDENADPSTDQPQGHATFTDGADTCTITGLTDGTTYQLRAKIYYGGYVNYVVSSVVRATTVTDYNNKYFTIKNVGSNNANIYLYATYTVTDMSVSTNNGRTWTSYSSSSTSPGTLLGTISSGNSMMLKHTGALGSNGETRIYIQTSDTRRTTAIELLGNIGSLCCGDNFRTTQTMPVYAYQQLFSEAFTRITEVKANNLTFGTFDAISAIGATKLFYRCNTLVSGPDMSTIRTVGRYGMDGMFYECSMLATPPDLSSVTTVDDYGLHETFSGCAGLSTPPDLSSVTRIGNYGMQYMFFYCVSLTISPDLSNITIAGTSSMESMFYQCTSLETVYAPTMTWNTSKSLYWLRYTAASGTLFADASIIESIPKNNDSGCPSGWTKEILN